MATVSELVDSNMGSLWTTIDSGLTDDDIQTVLSAFAVSKAADYAGFPGDNAFTSFGIYGVFTSISLDRFQDEISRRFYSYRHNGILMCASESSNRSYFRYSYTTVDNLYAANFDDKPWICVWYKNEKGLLLSPVVGILNKKELVKILSADDSPTSEVIIGPQFHLSPFRNYYALYSSKKIKIGDLRHDGGVWNRNKDGIPHRRSRYRRSIVRPDIELRSIESHHPSLPLKRMIAWLFNTETHDFESNLLSQYYNIMAPLPIALEDFLEKRNSRQVSKDISKLVTEALSRGDLPRVILKAMSEYGYTLNIKQIYNQKRRLKGAPDESC